MTKTSAEARAERLAAALRANLKLRKMREREAAAAVDEPDDTLSLSPPAPSRSPR